jgi:hypothetical protein
MLSTMDAPTTRISRPLPHVSDPFFWSPHPLAHSPRSVAPSADTLAPLSCTARTLVELHRGPLSVPWPLSSFSRVCCLGGLCLLASNTRHPLVCPQPLCFARSMLTGLFIEQLELHRHRPKASLHPHWCSSDPESPLEVSKLSMPLISCVLPCCPCNRSSE